LEILKGREQFLRPVCRSNVSIKVDKFIGVADGWAGLR
jgi:hypothetical protein